ncbi:hypothetical protein B6U80_02075 [Candidatus Pacearchaeota archaeon ex4484_26]|nr:MAG: hypothetical protein B6U80_02075 [Candidatus Pacearchaeota archaeon ex4484_26]
MVIKLLKAWKNVLFSPEKIKENDFSFMSMFIISFIMGTFYTTAKYPILEEPGIALSKAIYTNDFWIASLWGGFAACGLLLLVPIMAFYGTKLLGQQIPIKKLEQFVFASMFLFLLPIPIYITFKCKILGLFPYFKYSLCTMPTFILATLITFFIFRRALKFNVGKSLVAAILVWPMCYFLPKWVWGYISWKIAHITTKMPLRDRCFLGMIYATIIIGTCYLIRRKKIKRKEENEESA